jgi:hypothetical protein
VTTRSRPRTAECRARRAELLFRYGKHFAKSTMRWIDQEDERALEALGKNHDDSGDDRKCR